MEDQEPTYVELYLPTCSMDPMLRRLDIPTPTYLPTYIICIVGAAYPPHHLSANCLLKCLAMDSNVRTFFKRLQMRPITAVTRARRTQFRSTVQVYRLLIIGRQYIAKLSNY